MANTKENAGKRDATKPKAGEKTEPDSTKAPASCARCAVRRKQHKLICELTEALGSKLKEDKDVRGTVSDYIRLLQIQKEMEEDQPKENRGDWGDGFFYPGGYELAFGSVKQGGKNFLQIAKATFELEISY